MASHKKNEDFKDMIIAKYPLDEAIQYIRRNLAPEDVFSDKQLSDWARDCGAIKLEDEGETHEEALKRLNLKVGDKVRIICSCNDYERGWNDTWNDEMGQYIGKIGKISFIGYLGVKITFGGNFDFNYPAFVLEKIENE